MFLHLVSIEVLRQGLLESEVSIVYSFRPETKYFPNKKQNLKMPRQRMLRTCRICSRFWKVSVLAGKGSKGVQGLRGLESSSTENRTFTGLWSTIL